MTDGPDARPLPPAAKLDGTRRRVLGALGTGTLLLGMGLLLPDAALAAKSDDDNNVLSETAVLRDPEIPVAGNADGDISIVEFFDFQCPYCRKVAPDLRALAKEDGKIRLVFKDWPVLGGASIYAARLTLASKFQDKYIVAHEALIGLTSRLSEAGIRDALSAAGVDVARATADLAGKGKVIDAILARNNAQAKAFGFQGTPSFIVGKFRVPGVLTKEQFTLAIADARKAAAQK
ncbi:DsbA family protein [Rhodopseudomonas palustris]|uniref:Twin-arginine translocation pathway signal n=1 Tax=Rhodopseudomonas palustris (strain BisB18) TaxID=316056 RepID=Q21BP1_RHOPB